MNQARLSIAFAYSPGLDSYPRVTQEMRHAEKTLREYIYPPRTPRTVSLYTARTKDIEKSQRGFDGKNNIIRTNSSLDIYVKRGQKNRRNESLIKFSMHYSCRWQLKFIGNEC